MKTLRLDIHISFTLPALLLAFLTIALTSCGGSSQFKVEGQLADGKSMTVRYVYYDAAGSQLLSGMTVSKDGKFEIGGSVAKPSLLEISDNNYVPLAYVPVEDGDEIKVEIKSSTGGGFTASGSEMAQKWSDFFKTAGYEPDAVYKAVQKFGTEYPTLSVSLTSLENLGQKKTSATEISEISYISSSDSALVLDMRAKALNLLIVNDEAPGDDYPQKDSLREVRRLRPATDMAMTEISVYSDIDRWAREEKRDTVSWKRGYAPGGPASPGLDVLQISSLPVYILTDHNGKVLYKGSSIADLQSQLNSL